LRCALRVFLSPASAMTEQEVQNVCGVRSRRARFCRKYLWQRGTRFFIGLSWVRGTPLGLAPQRTSNHKGDVLPLLPPFSFLCCVMELLVVCGAEWDRKLIADLDA